MMLRSPAETVERFFAEYSRAGLVLPNGWYGRPFDSLFSLTLAVDSPEGLKIEIEGGRELKFQGAVAITRTKFDKYPALSIEGFQRVTWMPHSPVSQKLEHFDSGAVVFVSR